MCSFIIFSAFKSCSRGIIIKIKNRKKKWFFDKEERERKKIKVTMRSQRPNFPPLGTKFVSYAKFTFWGNTCEYSRMTQTCLSLAVLNNEGIGI